jgi:hypothetical protein
MISTVDRGAEDQVPRLGSDGSGAPAFPIAFSRPAFSRPAAFAGRQDSRSNSFRWTGAGTLHVLERGLIVAARRRSVMGLHVADERFVPASEICDVYREGNSVRVDLRGDPQRKTFFQFWTSDAGTAGTIVRLLPTTRTIEYDGSSAAPLPEKVEPSPRRSSLRRALLPIAAIICIASLIIADRLWRTAKTDSPLPQVTVPKLNLQNQVAAQRVEPPPPRATAAEIIAAQAYLLRFDDRIESLRSQHRMAFAALQSGNLSQADFINGLNTWLLPQWRALYGELNADTDVAGSLRYRVRRNLVQAVSYSAEGLREYAVGLQEKSYIDVMKAFDRLSAAHDAQRDARQIVESATP